MWNQSNCKFTILSGLFYICLLQYTNAVVEVVSKL